MSSKDHTVAVRVIPNVVRLTNCLQTLNVNDMIAQDGFFAIKLSLYVEIKSNQLIISLIMGAI